MTKQKKKKKKKKEKKRLQNHPFLQKCDQIKLFPVMIHSPWHRDRFTSVFLLLREPLLLVRIHRSVCYPGNAQTTFVEISTTKSSSISLPVLINIFYIFFPRFFSPPLFFLPSLLPYFLPSFSLFFFSCFSNCEAQLSKRPIYNFLVNTGEPEPILALQLCEKQGKANFKIKSPETASFCQFS